MMPTSFLELYVILCASLLSVRTSGAVSILLTSNWSGISSDINPVMRLVFDNYKCPGTYQAVYTTPGLSFQSQISEMTTESARLNSSNIVYEIGESNAFINFIYPTTGTNVVQILKMYPTDAQLIQVVIAVVDALYDPSVPKKDIVVILSRSNDLNNLNVNNYENFVRQINLLNWYNVRILDYQSAENIIYQLRLNPFYNIISLLSDPSSNRDLVEKAYMANLMGWRYRWIIVNLLGEYTLLQDQTKFGLGVLTNNVSIITFADQTTSKTGRSVLLEDALRMVRTTDCDISKPSSVTATSGVINVTPISRENFKYTLFQNPGQNASGAFFITQSANSDQLTLPSNLNFVPFSLNVSNSLLSTKAKVFRIGYVYDPPFSFKNDSNYSGFWIDVLVNILSENKVSYTFIDLTDPSAGSLNTSTLSFDHLLGFVQNGIVDTVSLAFIITNDRLNYFDFSSSVLTGYISVLYKIKTYQGMEPLQIYSFPFDWQVWVTFLGSALGVAFALAITDHVYPDKYARYKLPMSIFFSFSSLTHGAYFDPPRKLGGRVIMSFWWLFCLIVVILWACNYTALLSQTKSSQQMDTFFALLKQKKYRYGTLNDKLMVNFLSKTNDTNAQSMLQTMSEDTENGTVSDFSQAIQLIQNFNYAFIYEDRVVKYLKNLYCLDMFGSWMGFEYGIILPKNSERTPFFSSEVAKRRANGFINLLVNKTWPSRNDSCNSTFFLDMLTTTLRTYVSNTLDGSLDIIFMAGVFVILLGGGLGSLLLALVERLIRYIFQRKVEKRDMYEYDFTVEQLTKF